MNARAFALSRRGPWVMSNLKTVKVAMPNRFFAERGLFTLSGYEEKGSEAGMNRRIRTRMSGGVGGRRP